MFCIHLFSRGKDKHDLAVTLTPSSLSPPCLSAVTASSAVQQPSLLYVDNDAFRKSPEVKLVQGHY